MIKVKDRIQWHSSCPCQHSSHSILELSLNRNLRETELLTIWVSAISLFFAKMCRVNLTVEVKLLNYTDIVWTQLFFRYQWGRKPYGMQKCKKSPMSPMVSLPMLLGMIAYLTVLSGNNSPNRQPKHPGSRKRPLNRIKLNEKIIKNPPTICSR